MAIIAIIGPAAFNEERPRLKALSVIGLAAAALFGAALAEQGDPSSWGAVGWGR